MVAARRLTVPARSQSPSHNTSTTPSVPNVNPSVQLMIAARRPRRRRASARVGSSRNSASNRDQRNDRYGSRDEQDAEPAVSHVWILH